MKIIELYITEEDDGSGISELSIVKNPAHHYHWEIFEDQTECGGECQLTQHFSDKGEEMEYFFSNTEGFKVEDLSQEEFYTITSNPKSIDTGDGLNGEVVRYYYAVDVGLGPTLIKESRKLCRQLIRKDLVYRDTDLTELSASVNADANNRQLVPRTRGTSVDLKIYKSGKYCRHLFKRIIWKIPQGVSTEEFVNKIPKRAKTALASNIGDGRPSVELQQGRGGISEYKIYMNSQEGAIGLLEGLVVYSSPKALFEGEPFATAICEIEYEGVRGFIGGIPENDNYFNEDVKVINSVRMEEFESYTDYPEYTSENAKRGIRLNEEVGNKCATQTGKVRAQQLANREPISEETIARMYSYLSRAEEYYDPNDTEACGTISVLLWGGLETKDWAERKLRQIQEELTKRYEYRMGCVQGYLDRGYGEEESRMKCYEEQYPWTDQYPDNVLPLSQEEDFLYDNPCQEGYIAYGTKIKNGREVPNCVPISASENMEHYEEDREMVEGVIELILQVEDMEERKKVVEHAIRTFTDEGVKFDLNDFLTRVGLLGQLTFADELNYEVTTVVMEPNRYIARRDEIGDIYYVFFSPDTIKKMARKFFKEDRHKSFNYEHSGLKLSGGYVYESWIVDDPENDKSNKMGFKVNPGTWMATIKWDSKEMFEKYILSNKTTGISLEGNFLSRPGNLNGAKMAKIGELDGLPIFDNQEEARKYGLEKYGCVGVHEHRPGEYMPCEAHDVLINVTNSLYNNNDEVFIDEIRTIINNFYKTQK